MRIKFTDNAKNDLNEIGRHYLELGGLVLVRRMVSKIKKEVMALAENPKFAPSYELVLGIRRLVVAKGAFLVFHRVTESHIEVIHVRRSEREPVTKNDFK